MDEIETVMHSDGSAFHALGLPDADDLVVRAELPRRVAGIVRARGETEPRRRTRIDPRAFAALVDDDLEPFHTERLLNLLRDPGHDIELRITPTQAGVGRLHVAI
jgi:hypothetical protein